MIISFVVGLLDHFQPPLNLRRHWHAFHNAWATFIASDLNRALPAGFFAESNVQFGIEIDVAAFEEGMTGRDGRQGTEALGEAAVWAPAAPSRVVELPAIGDVIEVLVYSNAAGPELAAAVELVSPSNKDRPFARDAFVKKCLWYLSRGVGVVVVDIVTTRGGNLHAKSLEEIGETGGMKGDLYAVAYRPVSREGRVEMEAWENELALGDGLPEVPLWVKGAECVGLDLGGSYSRTCGELRIG